MSSTGGMYRPGSYNDIGGYGSNKYDDYRSEDRYKGRDDYRDYDYGRDREGAYYRDGDSYNRDGDRYGRDPEERYGKDSYRDGESRGRSRSNDDYHYGRSRSSDQYRDRDQDVDDDGRYSSRGGERAESADDSYHGEGKLDRKFSEQNLSAPPSYEEAVNESQSPNLNEREGESSTAAGPKPPVPPVFNNAAPQTSPIPPPEAAPIHPADSSPPPPVQNFGLSDEFDPRIPTAGSAAPPTSKTAGEDLLGSLSDSFNPLAIMPATPYPTFEVEQPFHAGIGPSFASQPAGASSQGCDNPFGETPFRAVPSTDNMPTQQHAPTQSFPSNPSHIMGQPHVGVPGQETAPNNVYTNSISGLTYSTAEAPAVPSHQAPDYAPQLFQPSNVPPEISNPNMYGSYAPQMVPTLGQVPAQMKQHIPHQSPNYGVENTSQFPQMGQISSQANASSTAGPLALVPQQQDKDAFETKSTVWADTLSRGLVNLNISGRKTNPLADIGVDFDALNRKEKRMEKTPANPPISTINMGKAMGSGSGIGRVGASALRPPPNPMTGSNMGMNMGGGIGPAMGMGMGGYSSPGQPMGMNPNMGMGMNAGMVQRPGGAPLGQGTPGAYNPMMGASGYNQQQYGGGYR